MISVKIAIRRVIFSIIRLLNKQEAEQNKCNGSKPGYPKPVGPFFRYEEYHYETCKRHHNKKDGGYVNYGIPFDPGIAPFMKIVHGCKETGRCGYKLVCAAGTVNHAIGSITRTIEGKRTFRIRDPEFRQVTLYIMLIP